MAVSEEKLDFWPFGSSAWASDHLCRKGGVRDNRLRRLLSFPIVDNKQAQKLGQPQKPPNKILTLHSMYVTLHLSSAMLRTFRNCALLLHSGDWSNSTLLIY